jgi:hypothetical protein
MAPNIFLPRFLGVAVVRILGIFDKIMHYLTTDRGIFMEHSGTERDTSGILTEQKGTLHIVQYNHVATLIFYRSNKTYFLGCQGLVFQVLARRKPQ